MVLGLQYVESAESAIDRLVGNVGAQEIMVPHRGPSMIGGAYEGADQFDKTMALWSPPLLSADAEILPNKGGIDARVRDLQRNDGYVHAGQMLHRDGIVGAMYLLNSAPDIKVLGMDDKWAEEFQEEVEAKFMLAAESDNRWFDAARVNSLTELCRLAIGVYTAGGEVLATAEYRRDQGRPFRTCIQMVDADRLSTPWDVSSLDLPAGQRVRGGVHQNRYGEALGYHIRKAHTSDFDLAMSAWEWTYVPARKPWGRPLVLHIKEQMRVDQTRAVAEMVSGIKATRIAHRFRDITLQQAVISAMYAASIESDLPTAAVFAQMGAGNVPDDLGEAVTSYAGQYLQAIQQYTRNSKHMAIDGVRIPHFFPGTRLSIKQVGAPGGVGQEFEQSVLRYIAAILGVSYEELSRDYSKTNYSSARAAMTKTWQFMQARKKIVADRLANWVYSLWLEEMINNFQLETVTASMPNFYEGLNKEAYCNATWIGAARGQIDELKETQAAVLRIKQGLSTREEELARFGKDWRKVFAQLAREKKLSEKLGIEFVEDNMQNAMTGAPREKDASEGGGGSGGE